MERLEEQIESLKAENDTLKQRLATMTTQMAENRKANKKVLSQRDAEVSRLKNTLNDLNYNFEQMCSEKNALSDDLKNAYEKHFATKENLNDILDARDYEIAHQKEELKKLNDTVDAIKKNWHVANTYTNDVIIQRGSEVESLKKQLAEQIEFTEKTIAQANSVESDLFIKNAELTARIGMITEMSERQSTYIYEMERKEKDFANQSAKLLTTEQQLASTKAQLNRANEMLTAIGGASSYIADVLSHRQ
jgi:chromosome segregation ATPase